MRCSSMRRKLVRPLIMMGAVVAVVATIGGVAVSQALSESADERAADVVVRLQAAGVQVKDWSLSGATPNRLLLTVASETSGWEPTFTTTIMRGVAQAIKQGAQFTEYEVRRVGADGSVLGDEGFNADDMADFISQMKWEPPTSTNEEALSKVEAALAEVKLGSLGVKSTMVDPDGADYYRSLLVTLAGDVPRGDEGSVSGATQQVLDAVKKANTNGAGIAVVRIDATDSSNQFLVREMHDLEAQVSSATWTDESFFPGWLSSRPPRAN